MLAGNVFEQFLDLSPPNIPIKPLGDLERSRKYARGLQCRIFSLLESEFNEKYFIYLLTYLL